MNKRTHRDGSPAALVRARRKERGLSQEALAELLGVRQPTLSYIESGINSPSLALAVGLERELKIPVEAWIAEEVA